MRQSRAFTVRDLAALLCLAALALPVLAGALGGAKDLSAAERCRATLAALTRAVLVYTQQNRGYMPVYQHRFYSTDSGRYIRAPEYTYRSAVAFSGVLGVNPTTGLLADARGFGLLYAQGFIRLPEMFYCPGPMPDVRYSYANYPKPWGSALGPGSTFIRLGYMWNPWVKRIPGGYDEWTYEDALAISRHPKERFLVSDLLLTRSTISHRPSVWAAEWNLAYPDGHAAPYQNATLLRWVVADLPSSVEWGFFNDYIRPYLPGANVGGSP